MRTVWYASFFADGFAKCVRMLCLAGAPRKRWHDTIKQRAPRGRGRARIMLSQRRFACRSGNKDISQRQKNLPAQNCRDCLAVRLPLFSHKKTERTIRLAFFSCVTGLYKTASPGSCCRRCSCSARTSRQRASSTQACSPSHTRSQRCCDRTSRT